MKIKDLSKIDRPREKLEKYELEQLGDLFNGSARIAVEPLDDVK